MCLVTPPGRIFQDPAQHMEIVQTERLGTSDSQNVWALSLFRPLLPAHPFLGGIMGSLLSFSASIFQWAHEVLIWHWPPGRKWLSTSGLLHPQLPPQVFQRCLYFTVLHSERASWNFAVVCKAIRVIIPFDPVILPPGTNQKKMDMVTMICLWGCSLW